MSKGSDKCFISVLNAFFTAGLRTEGERKREIWIKNMQSKMNGQRRTGNEGGEEEEQRKAMGEFKCRDRSDKEGI